MCAVSAAVVLPDLSFRGSCAACVALTSISASISLQQLAPAGRSSIADLWAFWRVYIYHVVRFMSAQIT